MAGLSIQSGSTAAAFACSPRGAPTLATVPEFARLRTRTWPSCAHLGAWWGETSYGAATKVKIAAHFAIASAELPGRNESERKVTSKEMNPEAEAAMAWAVEVWPLLER